MMRRLLRMTTITMMLRTIEISIRMNQGISVVGIFAILIVYVEVAVKVFPSLSCTLRVRV
jgi:hypothetical protein